jgi:hypothetical protein
MRVKIETNYINNVNLISEGKILSNIFISMLTPYADENTGDYQCGFGCNM